MAPLQSVHVVRRAPEGVCCAQWSGRLNEATPSSSEGIESHSVLAPSRVTMNNGRDRRTCPTRGCLADLL